MQVSWVFRRNFTYTFIDQASTADVWGGAPATPSNPRFQAAANGNPTYADVICAVDIFDQTSYFQGMTSGNAFCYRSNAVQPFFYGVFQETSPPFKPQILLCRSRTATAVAADTLCSAQTGWPTVRRYALCHVTFAAPAAPGNGGASGSGSGGNGVASRSDKSAPGTNEESRVPIGEYSPARLPQGRLS
jgi:hypothetical protein